ncbi:flagellar basal body P-ring formation chaperone FlgA [Shewanella algidipiscicola]|nr:flagellar basal body P-ring formation chaperone FlgA [Shewanella algidipiscicola]
MLKPAVIGSLTSLFLLGVFGLLPLPVYSQTDTASATTQIEQQMQRSIETQLSQWQQQQAIDKVQHKIMIRVPSGADNLEPCPQKITIDPPQGLPFGRVQRKLSCPSLGWSLYVRAKVTLQAYLPVANRNLQRDEIVTSADLHWKMLPLKASDQDVITQEANLLGQQVTRKLRKNKPIRAAYLEAPRLINVGDEVIIEASSEGFYANMLGVALDVGKEGDAIRVKNSSSGKVITAYVVAKGRVRTQF